MLPLKAKPWVGLGLLGLGAALCGLLGCHAGEADPERAFPAVPGKAVRGSLRPGGFHEYSLPLRPGEVFDATVEQEGIDLALTLSGPGGEPLAIDSPRGTRGPERVVDVAEAGGTWRLRITAAPGGAGGGYVLRLREPGPAGPRDRVRARACREYSRGEALRKGSPDRRGEALAHYREAFRLGQEAGDGAWQLDVAKRWGRLLQDVRDPGTAIEVYRRALPLAQDPGDRVFFLSSLTLLQAYRGDLLLALQAGEEAAALAPGIDDPTLQAAAFNNLGVAYRLSGQTDKALESFDRSLQVAQAAELDRPAARALANRAEALLALGNPRPVLGLGRQALQNLEKIGDPGVGQVERILGVAYDALGSPVLALHSLDTAVDKARAAGSSWEEELSLNFKGSTLLDLEALEQARAAFAEAARSARESGNLGNEAFGLSGQGWVLLGRGDAAGAIDFFAQAERLYRQTADPIPLALVLHGRALAERRLGRIEESLQTIDQALEMVEELRDSVGPHELRAHVIGARADLYDLRVDLLLDLHEQDPDRGFDAEAFAASEWRRARSALEMVRRLAVGSPGRLPEALVRRQETLRNRLQLLAQEKLKAGFGRMAGGQPRELAAIQQDIEEALAQWQSLAEEMRRQSPAYAAVTAPKLVGVPEVRQLLDADTALIAFTLGEERSILWWIDRDGVEVVPRLPAGRELEVLAHQAYEALSQPRTRNRVRMQNLLESLGAHLLGPVAERLPKVRRLVVVADGVLQTLPFAALTVPGSGEPLVETHVVAQLPSASLAAELRTRQRERPEPSAGIAVFGDPVFGPEDARFRAGRGEPGLDREALPRGEPSRLPESLREAEHILALFPADVRRSFLGFAAHRQAALDPALARFRYIHFATHGFVDLDNPDLSGIQLSRINPQGRPWDGEGILRFYEIYNLRLPADLVTLSACRTAAGPQIAGEGPLAMSRSFLYAGASRVVGSLWDVGDADAADLMTLFYQALVRDGASPAEALQQAQREMRRREKSDGPHAWAGFILQGDWR